MSRTINAMLEQPQLCHGCGVHLLYHEILQKEPSTCCDIGRKLAGIKNLCLAEIIWREEEQQDLAP